MKFLESLVNLDKTNEVFWCKDEDIGQLSIFTREDKAIRTSAWFLERRQGFSSACSASQSCTVGSSLGHGQ